MADSNDTTQILAALSRGDFRELNRLAETVYTLYDALGERWIGQLAARGAGREASALIELDLPPYGVARLVLRPATGTNALA